MRTYLHSKDILASADDVCNIKLGRQTAVLAVAQELAIEPGIECVVDSLKVEGDPAWHGNAVRLHCHWLRLGRQKSTHHISQNNMCKCSTCCLSNLKVW